MQVKLPQMSWFGDTETIVDLPDEWEVQVCGIPADSCPPLGAEELRNKFAHPIGSKRIRELAEGKTDIVIIFDDISRGTPVQPLAEIVLEELNAAKVNKESIRFICALATHGAHTRIEFEKKLGSKIVREYPVFNHNPYENCTVIGSTSRGTVVAINSEVMKCDLKIGIGSISPHPSVGFGGGGKILFPGVAGIQSIIGNHELSKLGLTYMGRNPASGLGRYQGNEQLSEIEEATRMARLDIKVDALINSRRNIVDLYVGDPISEHRAGMARAERLYASPVVRNMDVVIANANAKANEAACALWLADMALRESGGTVIIVNHSPMGQVVHYLNGCFGHYIGGHKWQGVKKFLPTIKNVILYTPYPDYTSSFWFGPPDQIKWATTREEVEQQLREFGAGTKAAVFVDATLQYFPLLLQCVRSKLDLSMYH